MNVYSIRLIPQLKIKLCQFLGIASEVAMSQLDNRLYRLEKSMDRFENQIRRLRRRHLVLEAEAVSAETPPKFPKAKKSVTKKRSTKPKLAKTTKTKKSAPVLKEISQAVAEVQEIRPVVEVVEATEEPSENALTPCVFLIQMDPQTRETVQSYFGEGVEVKELSAFQEFSEEAKAHQVVAVFFDRTLLSDDEARETLEGLKEKGASFPFIGVSSYLTLSLAKSVPGWEELATFLTKPITYQSLVDLFEERDRQAIS